jgi:hypothetical protein
MAANKQTETACVLFAVIQAQELLELFAIRRGRMIAQLLQQLPELLYPLHGELSVGR